MFDLTPSGQRQFTTSITCAALGSVAVGVRVFCKVWYKQGVKSDDWWLGATLLTWYSGIAVTLWGLIVGGKGREMTELMMIASKDHTFWYPIGQYLMSLLIGFSLSTATVFCCKMSILCFYRHIFFIKDGYRRASLVVMACSIMWFVATQIAIWTTCTPIDSFWDLRKYATRKCHSFPLMYLGTGIVDTIIDTVILLLPVRMAFGLHLPMRTRFMVAGIFALGGFVIVTNIVRLHYTYLSRTKFVSFAQSGLWLPVHMATAIICACLPVYKPLWSSVSTSVTRYISSLRSALSSRNGSKRSNGLVIMDDTSSVETFKKDPEMGFSEESLPEHDSSMGGVKCEHESDKTVSVREVKATNSEEKEQVRC